MKSPTIHRPTHSFLIVINIPNPARQHFDVMNTFIYVANSP